VSCGQASSGGTTARAVGTGIAGCFGELDRGGDLERLARPSSRKGRALGGVGGRVVAVVVA
jgi:hypothetical protein